LNIDPKDLGRQLGRRLAEAKVETEKSAKEFEKVARQTLDEVVKDLTTEADKAAKTVKAGTKKVVKEVKTEAKKAAKVIQRKVGK
jgi:vacuolar-type H+-ATPase subunit H